MKMVASTDIKYFVHTNTNAPQLDNVQGGMIAVLDACLVNGLTLGAVNSMTAAGTMVTVNFGSAHNLLRSQVLKIAGAVQAEYNGEHRILSVPTTSSITFEVAIAPSASPATGTITAGLPPLGWSLPFTGTGKRAYKNTDIDSPYFRVVDAVDPAYSTSYAKYAKVGMVEDMTDIDTMIGHQVPYDAALPNKNWVGTGSGTTAINGWAKWYYATSSLETTNYHNCTHEPSNGSRVWIIVGDRDSFYIFNKTVAAAPGSRLANGFGKLERISNVNAGGYFLQAADNYVVANGSNYLTRTALICTASEASCFGYLDHTGLPSQSKFSSRVLSNGTYLTSGYTETFASPTANNSVFSSKILLVEGGVPRGFAPIVKWVHQIRPYTDLQKLEDDGRAIVAINVTANTSIGQLLADLGAL